MFKKIFCFVVIFILIFSLYACNDNNGKEVIEGDYSITVTVDKTSVKVGETVELTVVFKNLSGKDIPIEIPSGPAVKKLENGETYEIEDIIIWGSYLKKLKVQLAVTQSLLLPRPIKTLEKDAVITRKIQICFEERGKYIIEAVAVFNTGDDWHDFNWINGKKIEISVKK